MHRDNVYEAGKAYSWMANLIGVKLLFRKSSNIDLTKKYVYVGNHQNTYDLATISHSALPGVVTVGKKSLKWIPIFGLIYWLSGNIMIDRKNTGKARGTLNLTAEKMRERNLSVYMFPEGTRSRGRGLLPFKTGAFRLAAVENTPIVPIVCSNTNDGKIKLNRWNNGTIIIEMLDPIMPEKDTTAKDVAKSFHSLMLDTFNRINHEADVLSGRVKD
jgi:1-acyl-sn-glycerol-3-phosphate acyltransferase